MTDWEPTMNLQYRIQRRMVADDIATTHPILQQQWRRTVPLRRSQQMAREYIYEWRDIPTAHEKESG